MSFEYNAHKTLSIGKKALALLMGQVTLSPFSFNYFAYGVSPDPLS